MAITREEVIQLMASRDVNIKAGIDSAISENNVEVRAAFEEKLAAHTAEVQSTKGQIEQILIDCRTLQK